MKNSKKFKIILPAAALLLALSLVFTSGCGGLGLIGLGTLGGLSCIGKNLYSNTQTEESSAAESQTSESSSEESSSSSSSSGGSASTSDGKYTYKEYDPTEFEANVSKLTELASGKDSDAVIDLYDELYDEYVYISDNESALYIAYSENPSDEYLSEQYTSYSSMMTDLADQLYVAIKAVCDGPCADDFKDHVGEDDFEEYASYEPMTDEQQELFDEESELVDEYNQVSTQYADTDDNGESLYKAAGPIYVELVQVRNKIAQSYGYDNYAEYADAEIYERDFSEEEIESFCDTVKKFSSDFYNTYYYSTATYIPYYIQSSFTTSELLSYLKTEADKIGTITSNAASKLIDEKLYNIGDDSKRLDGAYTLTFDGTHTPYIFATTADNMSDFVTISHEFGHFCNATINDNPNILLNGYGSLELEEIHSNGLQAIYTYYYDDIYGSYSSYMQAYNVINLLSNVVEGCLFDEFQREVYENPDMTYEEIDALYTQICEEYGDTLSGEQHWWVYVNHNFESPLYYFSYAASGFTALQIWLDTQTDINQAIDLWTEIVELGPYTCSYKEAMEKLGISDFTNQLTVAMTCSTALSFVQNNSYSLSN